MIYLHYRIAVDLKCLKLNLIRNTANQISSTKWKIERFTLLFICKIQKYYSIFEKILILTE